MNNFIKKLIAIFFTAFCLLGSSCTSLKADVLRGEEKSSTAEVSKEIQFQEIALNKFESKTREASVKVYTESGGHGSGAYFIYEGYHVVFTAAHVAVGSRTYLVVDKYGNKRLGMLAYIDEKVDFAIILIPAFEKIKPIKFKTPNYIPNEEIGKELIFSGYPGRQSLRTTRGIISGVEGRYFVMHSTAWSGSSGSCVFDSDGNFVGILFAITMAQFSGDPVLLESMVWVEPYNAINWRAVKLTIKSLN